MQNYATIVSDNKEHKLKKGIYQNVNFPEITKLMLDPNMKVTIVDEKYNTCPNCGTLLSSIKGILDMKKELDQIHKERTDLTRMIGMILIDHGNIIKISQHAQLELDIPNGIIDEETSVETGEIILKYRGRGKWSISTIW